MNTSCFFFPWHKKLGQKNFYRLSSFLHIPYAFLDVVIKCDILDNNQSPNLLNDAVFCHFNATGN